METRPNSLIKPLIPNFTISKSGPPIYNIPMRSLIELRNAYRTIERAEQEGALSDRQLEKLIKSLQGAAGITPMRFGASPVRYTHKMFSEQYYTLLEQLNYIKEIIIANVTRFDPRILKDLAGYLLFVYRNRNVSPSEMEERFHNI